MIDDWLRITSEYEISNELLQAGNWCENKWKVKQKQDVISLGVLGFIYTKRQDQYSVNADDTSGIGLKPGEDTTKSPKLGP